MQVRVSACDEVEQSVWGVDYEFWFNLYIKFIAKWKGVTSPTSLSLKSISSNMPRLMHSLA